ncbi:MAG: hypothetical protein IJZ49_00370 [Alistipes sp.]|nr:hypothetical protein [Alistipes sp.]
MNNPYDLLKDTAKLRHYEQTLGIEDYRIFDTVLTNNEKIDRALSFVVSRISGIVDLSGILGWLNMQRIKNDSQHFLEEQVARLKKNPAMFDDELSINLLVFACMAVELTQVINMNNRMSDVRHILLGLFSSKRATKWQQSLYARLIEIVRWSYSSSVLLVIYYMIICEGRCIPYDLIKLKSGTQYIGRLYVSCDDAMSCIITSYNDLISCKYQYIHDILLEYTEPISLFEITIEPKKVVKEVFKTYTSGDNRTQILNEIEKLTIK